MTVEPPSGNERAYLEAYRHATAMPDAARDRVWARLSGGPGGPIGGEAANDPGVHQIVGDGGGWLARPGLWIAAAVAVVSGAVVLGLLASDRPSSRLSSSAVALDVGDRSPVEPEPVPAISRPPAELSPAELSPAEPAPALDQRRAASTQRHARRSTAARETEPSEAPPSSLGEERRLIERTHAALGRGETDVALALLGQHAREYAEGIFVEEREALRAIATCRAGQLDNGRAAAEEFLASYPDAVLAARVRNTCALEG